MVDMKIRRATRYDARDLAGLRWDFKAEAADLDPEDRERFLDRQLTWFADALAGEWVAFVAEDDARLIGQVFVRVVDKVPSPAPGPTAIGYVTNFWVRPDRRGQGIGGALLDAVRSWADTMPLEALVVWPSDNWVPDYEQAGFHSDAVLQLPLARAHSLSGGV